MNDEARTLEARRMVGMGFEVLTFGCFDLSSLFAIRHAIF
jgi:hypothetical protein